MFERHDFLTPWSNDRPSFEKPVRTRIPSAIAGLITLFLIYRIGADLVSREAGLIAAVALATTFRFVLYARQGLTDVPVTMFVTLSIWGFLRAFTAGDGESRRYGLAAWAATGCAALTKGPVAVIGPLAWVLFALLTDRRAALRRLHAPAGLLVAAAIALPWPLMMVALYGRSFLDIALGYEVVARYVSPDFPGRDRGFFYFYGVWLGDAAPWSLFFLAGLAWAAASWRTLDEGTRRAVRLALAWFMTVLLLFSFSSYKLPHYLMPAYPATALMVGMFGAAVLRATVSRRWLWRLPALLAALLFGAGAVLVSLLLRRAFRLPFSDPSYLLPGTAAGRHGPDHRQRAHRPRFGRSGGNRHHARGWLRLVDPGDLATRTPAVSADSAAGACGCAGRPAWRARRGGRQLRYARARVLRAPVCSAVGGPPGSAPLSFRPGSTALRASTRGLRSRPAIGGSRLAHRGRKGGLQRAHAASAGACARARRPYAGADHRAVTLALRAPHACVRLSPSNLMDTTPVAGVRRLEPEEGPSRQSRGCLCNRALLNLPPSFRTLGHVSLRHQHVD